MMEGMHVSYCISKRVWCARLAIRSLVTLPSPDENAASPIFLSTLSVIVRSGSVSGLLRHLLVASHSPVEFVSHVLRNDTYHEQTDVMFVRFISLNQTSLGDRVAANSKQFRRTRDRTGRREKTPPRQN